MNRRDFLKRSAKGILGLSAMLGAGEVLSFLGSPVEEARKTEFDLGPADQYPIGTRKLIPEANSILFHTEAGFRALSLVCTHLGCTVSPTPQGFACPCHNSHYDGNGKVVRGPAANPLQVLSVKITSDGHLILLLPSS